MRSNRIKAMWREGKPVLLGWMGSADPYLTEVMAHAGYDVLLLDMQHGMGISFDQAAQWLQVVSTTDTVPMVRVPWNEPVYIQSVLDAGAYGIIVPLVNNAEEAAKAGMSCRYPPIGFRSLGPNRANFYAGDDYYQHANEEIICLVMIENINTIPHLEEMAKAPGIDGFHIGPFDLALSMDATLPNYRDDEKHNEACQKVLDVAKAHGLVAGTYCASPEEVRDRFRQGFMLCHAGEDAEFLAAGAKAELEQIRKP